MYLRATQKVLRRLQQPPSEQVVQTETALGDWFVNRVVVGRRPILLLVSSASLLPMLEPAQNVRSLPARLPSLVRARLQRFGIESHLIESEVAAMASVVVAATNNRSVVGTLVDFALVLPYYLPGSWNEHELFEAEARLAHTPCTSKVRGLIWPDLKAPELLMSRWAN